jgi:hypothetical protein
LLAAGSSAANGKATRNKIKENAASYVLKRIFDKRDTRRESEKKTNKKSASRNELAAASSHHSSAQLSAASGRQPAPSSQPATST